MKVRFLKSICLAALIAVTGCAFYACGPGALSGSKQEGVIEFDTKGVDPSHPLYGLAPSSATMKFKGDRFAIEMSIMGMFNTSIIGDNKNKTMAQTVKFLDIKQACIEHEKELAEENLKKAFIIKEVDETKKILGFKCYKLQVTKANDPSSTFDAWYTKELGLENFNTLTPYASVKGVLLDYRIERMGMELHFLAKSYAKSEVSDKTFEIPASMKIVSHDEMQKFIDELQ